MLCTSNTITSARIAELRMPTGTIYQFVPLDAPQFVNRFLNHWCPDLAIFVESELWPNLIMTAAQRGIPLILVNGRLSERSFKRWRRAPQSVAALLRSFDLCLAQSEAQAKRYRELGALRVFSIGNLKFDVPSLSVDSDSLARLKAAIQERTVIAGTSTHAGEEIVLIDAHRRLRYSFPGLLTIIAPRHPDRGCAILESARAADLRASLRSRKELPAADTDIYVADTIGELGVIYRLAPIVFVGGSLANRDGQNPIELIKLGAAILHGPHVWNFAEIYAALNRAHGAKQVTDVVELTTHIAIWLSDPGARMAVASAARTTVAAMGGALELTLAALGPYILSR